MCPCLQGIYLNSCCTLMVFLDAFFLGWIVPGGRGEPGQHVGVCGPPAPGAPWQTHRQQGVSTRKWDQPHHQRPLCRWAPCGWHRDVNHVFTSSTVTHPHRTQSMQALLLLLSPPSPPFFPWPFFPLNLVHFHGLEYLSYEQYSVFDHFRYMLRDPFFFQNMMFTWSNTKIENSKIQSKLRYSSPCNCIINLDAHGHMTVTTMPIMWKVEDHCAFRLTRRTSSVQWPSIGVISCLDLSTVRYNCRMPNVCCLSQISWAISIGCDADISKIIKR